MNPVIITIIIAVGANIVGFICEGWLTQRAMKNRIDVLKSHLDKRFGAVNAHFKR
jgi:uncharacterized membrane-anchored protein YhcB (DUF1043 family)